MGIILFPWSHREHICRFFYKAGARGWRAKDKACASVFAFVSVVLGQQAVFWRVWGASTVSSKSRIRRGWMVSVHPSSSSSSIKGEVAMGKRCAAGGAEPRKMVSRS